MNDDPTPRTPAVHKGSSSFPTIPLSEAEAARRFAARARADNTLRGYRADWADFLAWCDERGLVALPATGEVVSLYIASRADELKVSTLQRRLAAISQAHKMAGFESPALRSREPLHSVWAGITRTKLVAVEKVAPALTEDVRHLVESLPTVELPDGTREPTVAARRDRALLLLGFAGALRRSELVALRVEDLAFRPEGLRVRVRRSKADQAGAGEMLGIRYGKAPLTCPVRAVRGWIRWIAITEGPLFREVDRHGNVADAALTPGSVARIVKRACTRAGLDAREFAGHSLRAGFATQAARAQVPERVIARHTRHRDLKTLRGYIREGELFSDENPTDGLGL